jgi:predicted PurR-regulated permease PerM
MSSQTARTALVVIAIVAAGAALYWMRTIAAPLVLAVFLMVMIDSLARGVRRFAPFISEAAAVPAALILIVCAFVGAAWVIANGCVNFAARSAQLGTRLNELIAEVAGFLHLKVTPTVDQLLSQLESPAWLGNAANLVQAVGSAALFVLIYLGFLMAARAGFKRKAAALFSRPDHRQEARTIIARIRDGVESYVWIQTVTGLMIAVPAFALMGALGLENAGFWAFVIFLSNFVPIIGGMIAVIGPALFALVQFTTYVQALVLVIALPIILLVVGNIVFPRMQAKSQNIDPVVVLFSFAFWGALWGPTGAFLSTPLTVMAIAICAEFKASRWVAVLLSADGEPYPDVVETPAPERAPRRLLFGARAKKISEP